jgi:hypothetical protein
MKFRESQKYKADLSKGLGYLLTVPIGNYGLLFIFEGKGDHREMLLSLFCLLVGGFLFFLGYGFTKREELKKEKDKKND